MMSCVIWGARVVTLAIQLSPATRTSTTKKDAPSSSLSADEEWGIPWRNVTYDFGSTIKLRGLLILCGEPGACVTRVAVTLNTYSLPAFRLIAYK